MTRPDGRYGPVGRRPGFRLLLTAYTVSQLGSAMSLVALPIIVYRLTGSAVLTGLLGVIEVAPYLVLGLFSGTLADRVPGRLIPVVTDTVSGLAFVVLAAVLALGHASVAAVYAAALVTSVCFVFHSSPFPALTRRLVGRERIVAASSRLQLADTVTAVAGSAVAALLVTTAPIAWIIAVDATSFLLSAALIGLIRVPPAAQPHGPAEPPRWTVQLRNGVRFFWTTRDLRNAIVAGLGMAVTGGALLSLLTPLAGQALGASPHGPAIPLLYAAGNLGSAVAAVALPVLHRRSTPGRIAVGGLAGNAAAYGVLLALPHWAVALPVMLAWQFTYTLVIVNNGAIRHLLTPVHMLGRVSATARMVAWGGAPLGASAGAALTAMSSVRTGLACCGIGVALGLAWAIAGRVGAIVGSPGPDPAAEPAGTAAGAAGGAAAGAAGSMAGDAR